MPLIPADPVKVDLRGLSSPDGAVPRVHLSVLKSLIRAASLAVALVGLTGGDALFRDDTQPPHARGAARELGTTEDRVGITRMRGE